MDNRPVALITGANNPLGIGAGIARALARSGHDLFLHGFRTRPERDREAREALSGNRMPGPELYELMQALPVRFVAEAIGMEGVRVACMEADLATLETLPTLFDRAEEVLSPVQTLILNAAACDSDTFRPAETLTDADRCADGWALHPIDAASFGRQFEVNARAPALLMAEFARRHVARKAQRGRIVAISTDGSPGFAGQISYGASKHALESFARAAARELGPMGITVNVLSLGPIQTGWIGPELERELVNAIPAGRIGRPEDVGAAAAFLVSPEADWITGQVIHVGGGHSM